MDCKGRDDRQKHARICESKIQTFFETLCRGFPREFVKYQIDVHSLQFTDEPGYTKFRRMFRGLFVRRGFQYDWGEQALRPA
jgi:hypothetical protein